MVRDDNADSAYVHCGAGHRVLRESWLTRAEVDKLDAALHNGLALFEQTARAWRERAARLAPAQPALAEKAIQQAQLAEQRAARLRELLMRCTRLRVDR